MKNNKGALWITSTAIFIALIVVGQLATTSFGNTLITGSWVNLMLIMAVMTCGFSSGAIVALTSPIFAKLLGIGPLWELIPFIMLGNVILILVWYMIGKMKFSNEHIVRVITLTIAAACKCLTLYLGIVKLAIPFLLNLPDPQVTKISAMFSIPQLFTALIGGALAVAILPVVSKFAPFPANKKTNKDGIR